MMNPFDIEPNLYTRVIRDSRHAYGHRFEVERPNRDWIWGVATLIVVCVAVVVMAGQI